MGFLSVVVTWFPFFVAVATFALAFASFARAPKSTLVRLFSVFAFTQALLAFIEWGYRHAPTFASAQQWINAGALWPLGLSAIWAFTWASAESLDSRRSTAIAFGMYPIGVVFAVLGFLSPGMYRVAEMRWWGFTYVLPDTLLMNIALVWGLIVSLLISIKVVSLFVRKRQARLHRAFVVAILTMIVITLIDSVVRAAAPEQLPELSTIGTAVFVIVIGFAVARYGMWEFAPQIAADTVLQTMGDAVVMVDDTGVIRYVNAATRSLFDLRSSPVGRKAVEYLPDLLLSRTALGKNQDVSIPIGNSTVLRASAGVHVMPARVGGRIVVLRDSEERIRFQEQLAHLAYHDPLTGLGNRASFFEKLGDLCHWTSRYPLRFAAAILLDLDRFKEINDAYGHAAGDDLLIATAERLEAVLRSTDFAFRLGGDEFAVLVGDISSQQGIDAVAAKLVSAFEGESLSAVGMNVAVTVSAGFSAIHPADTPEEVFARIDAGLYEAKKRRCTAIQFSRKQELPQTRRARLHRRVREALSKGHLTWHYQPIVSASGIIVGGESLARWDEEGSEPIAPSDFIPAAEEIGEIAAIGTASRTHALQLLETLPSPDVFISVNVSPREFSDEGFYDQILEQFRDSGSRSRIHLEITETQLLELGPTQHRMFSAFADAGVKFMIDDFGTGYSSFTRLRELPIHGVKLDRTFLAGADTDPRVRSVLEGAIQMVRGLGLVLVAEGVETAKQVELLRAAGCTHFQGFYFHRPLTAEQFREQLP